MILKQYILYTICGHVIIFTFIMWTYSDYRIKVNLVNILLVTKTFKGNKIVDKATKHYAPKDSRLKYLLIWTSPISGPLKLLGKGQEVFIDKICSVSNCYVTSNKTLFNNIIDYDVLLFHVQEIYNKRRPRLPSTRSPHQLFIVASVESSDYYPFCSSRFDNYFNLTWTYKLDSDIFFGYMIIRNKKGEIIGPSQTMHWEKLQDMTPADDGIKKKPKHKSIAAAWFVSNCKAPSGRDEYVRQLRKDLDQYNLVVDIYGKCGNKTCPREEIEKCLQIIERDYYFYFSFENSFSDDYVTEKLLHALKHYAVPVVYGIANYTRFMPDGIYLNAFKLGAKELAKQMAEIIHDKERYYNFFKWRNHYSYHYVEEAPEANPYCKLCEKVNDETAIKRTNTYAHLRNWWNPKKIRTHACPFKSGK